MPNQTPIILFKTPSPSSTLDPYTQTLASSSSSSYSPTFVPVLEETYQTSDLQLILESGPSHWEGVIMTSRRGAEGWIRGVREFIASDRKGKGKAIEGGWDGVPLFTVGTASSDQLEQSGIPEGYIPKDMKYEDENDQPPKSAIHLIPHILNTPPRSKGQYRQYLFIRGDKSTELLQDELKIHNREIREVLVYMTSPRDDILENLHLFKKMNGNRERKDGGEGWLGFFSPSGAEVVLPLVREALEVHNSAHLDDRITTDGDRLQQPKEEVQDPSSIMKGIDDYWQGWKIFVIGETTKRYLEEKGIKVHAVADRPTPEGLLEAIQEFDQHQMGPA